jgi:hypothetical protein
MPLRLEQAAPSSHHFIHFTLRRSRMFGLTPLGIIHTLISLLALGAGIACLVRDGRISPESRLGLLYIWATVATCLTGFGIFQHGGIGPPHILGVLTLLVLAFAAWPGGASLFGRTWLYVTTVCYSLTLFFHAIPGATETFTRIPVGRPLFAGPDDPALQALAGVMFVIFLAGAGWQVVQLRRSGRQRRVPTPLPTVSKRSW